MVQLASLLIGVTCLASAACTGFQLSPAADDHTIDAPGIGASGAPFCIKNALVTACVTTPPSQPVTLTGAIATDPGAPTCAADVSADTSNVCVVAGTSITIAAGQTVSAHGARPLVLLATDTITITGTLDVAGHLTGLPQPIGPAGTACNGATLPTINGGGAGGSFGSKGGNGGNDQQGGQGGIAATAIVPTALIGGCNGMTDNTNSGFGTAGGAGGALALLSKNAIIVDGSVDASGGGGGGGSRGNGGGGGGGAGGMIVLDAQSVTGGGNLFATGGGGGEGAGRTNGFNGADPPDPATTASGGIGSSGGGNGGNGAATMSAGSGGASSNLSAAGGGGGGGRGVIRLFTAPSVAVTLAIAPPPK